MKIVNNFVGKAEAETKLHLLIIIEMVGASAFYSWVIRGKYFSEKLCYE